MPETCGGTNIALILYLFFAESRLHSLRRERLTRDRSEESLSASAIVLVQSPIGPRARIPSARRVVRRGTDRFTRIPGLLITTWLPTWPMTTQPAFWKALTASLPEILASRATLLNRD